MKTKILSCLSAIAVCLVFANLSFAQNEDRVASAAGDLYVISAKAGGVNYVEGKVTVARTDSRSGYLVKGDRLEVGDKVTTGANGKAEILLNPGSYVRLGENTVFEFASTSLDDVKVTFTRGSAMLEVFADSEFKVAIETPKASFYAIKSGVYRVDVLADGSGKVSVWKGKAQIGEDEEATIKSGRSAVVNGNRVAVEKFDRGDKDTLEEWSKDRAKHLAKINSKLEREDLRNSLLYSFNRRGWGLYDSFGLWVYDRFSGYYCFLPFGYGWSSPYGYWYNRDLWYFRLPHYVYYQTPTVHNPSGNTTPNETIKTRVRVKPPFEAVEQSGAVEKKTRTVIFDDSTPASTSFPTRSASPPPAPAPIPVTPRSSSKGKPE